MYPRQKRVVLHHDIQQVVLIGRAINCIEERGTKAVSRNIMCCGTKFKNKYAAQRDLVKNLCTLCMYERGEPT